jgi:hypothetical protein
MLVGLARYYQRKTVARLNVFLHALTGLGDFYTSQFYEVMVTIASE